MADLGKKHECSACGAKFYDLGKTEIFCPKCGANEDGQTAEDIAAAAAAAKAAKEAEDEAALAKSKKETAETTEDGDGDDGDSEK